MEERKVRRRTQTRHHRLVATLPNQAKVFDLMHFPWKIRRQAPFEDDRAA